MAETQEQIFQKLKGWVPKWFFESPDLQQTTFYAMAKVWEKVESQVEEAFDATYITQAAGEDLDRHGAERDCPRNTLEDDSSYAVRIQHLEGISDKVTIKKIVDGIIFRGECIIQEHQEDGPFCGAGYGTFANRSKVIARQDHNAFTVVVPRQIAPPNTYASRGFYAGVLSAFAGNKAFVSAQRVLEIVRKAVAEAKAAGVAFRIHETNH